MPPRRPRRRARRRSPARPVILLVRSGGRARDHRGRPHPGVAAVAGLRRRLGPRPGRAGRASRPISRTPPRLTVRKLVDDLPSQTRQGLQATLDGAVQQTADEAARAQARRRRDAAGRRGDPVRRPSSPNGPRRGAAAGGRLRIPGHAAHRTRRRAAHGRDGDGRRERRSCRPPRPRTASPRPARCWRVRTPSTARCNGHCRPAPATGSSRRRSG